MKVEEKKCQNCSSEFQIEPEDFDFYEKIQVPPPTFCPDCRMQRRFVFRNERTLYKRQCDLCQQAILTTYSPDGPFTIYCKDCWYSDKWDPFTYGADYDWNKPFFQQFRELLERVPRLGLLQIHTVVNAKYSNFVVDVKNVYLAYSILQCEDIYYSRLVDDSRDCFDCFNLKKSEIIYENIDGARNFNTTYMLRSRDSINSSFLFGCVNCQNCFMSSNIRNKKHVFRNKQYTKEEYEKEMKGINFGSYKTQELLKKEFYELVQNSLHRFANLIKTVKSSGDNLESCKNVNIAFDVYNSEDIKFVGRVFDSRDVYDFYGCIGELMYEGIASGFNTYRNRFSILGESSKDVQYIDHCFNSSLLFGCTGLQKKDQCILNKQYSKKEYEELVLKIIKHMNDKPYIGKKGRVYKYGEFFPPEISPFAYNETVAQEYFPLTKESVLEQGYSWKDPEEKVYKITTKSENLPDHIKDVLDDITKEIIGCEHEGKCEEHPAKYNCGASCTTAFKIIPQELQFYRKMNLALPRLCPNCRHYQRLKQRNPLKLWRRQCVCDYKVYKNTVIHNHHPEGRCPNEFETSYPPERKEIVYCGDCYNSEVV